MKQLFYYDISSSKSPFLFSRKLFSLIQKENPTKRPLVFLCIGSDRSTGDSLGPLTGYKLQHIRQSDFSVFGTLQSPIHALNLQHALHSIYEYFENPFLIAIDAALGEMEHVGYVTLSNLPLSPGLGVKKSLPQVGDLCITGIVNQNHPDGSYLLQSTRLSTVMEMADFISAGIFLCMRSYSSSSITCISR